MKEGKKVCCFFGHRKIEETEDLKNRLYEIAENLILNEDVDTFLFGSKSDFDYLCRKVVAELKKKHKHIKRVYVRAEFPYINKDYEEFLLENFEETYYSEKILNAGKAVYAERNREMIDKSDICIVYYKESYAPSRRKNSKKDLFDYQPKSGTRIAYDYASEKNKKIINVAI